MTKSTIYLTSCVILLAMGIKTASAQCEGGFHGIACSEAQSLEACNQKLGCEWVKRACEDCPESNTLRCVRVFDQDTGCFQFDTQQACGEQSSNGCYWSSPSNGEAGWGTDTAPPPYYGHDHHSPQQSQGSGRDPYNPYNPYDPTQSQFGYNAYDLPEGLSAGAIVGIVIAVLVVHAAVILGYWWYQKNSKDQNENDSNESKEKNKDQEPAAPPKSWFEKHEGVFSWIVVASVIFAWILVVASVGSCQFIKSTNVGIGLFNYESINSCARFDSAIQLDAAFKAGRTFAVFSSLLASAALILVLLVQIHLFANRDYWWLALRICIYCTLWSVLFTFFAFGTGACDPNGVDCKVGAAAGVAIFNVLFLLALNILLVFVNPAKAPPSSILEASSETANKCGVKNDSKENENAAKNSDVLPKPSDVEAQEEHDERDATENDATENSSHHHEETSSI